METYSYLILANILACGTLRDDEREGSPQLVYSLDERPDKIDDRIADAPILDMTTLEFFSKVLPRTVPSPGQNSVYFLFKYL